MVSADCNQLCDILSVPLYGRWVSRQMLIVLLTLIGIHSIAWLAGLLVSVGVVAVGIYFLDLLLFWWK